jgi:endonuclease/exonuclease/phosphatase family metal-dependent hydrolase
VIPGLRVISANLKNGAADPEAFGELVETIEPDVVAVQELGFAQAEVLARLLPFGKLEPARNHKGMGIALRRPGSIRYLPLRYRGLFVAEVDVSDPGAGREPVEVVNAHIAAPHTIPLGRAFARRRDQLDGLCRYLDASPDRPRLLVGDLNSTSVWPLYRRLRRRFQDAALEVARRSGGRPVPTWGPWVRGRRLLRIDHALVNGFGVLDARVLRIPGSDHSALVVDLDLAG